MKKRDDERAAAAAAARRSRRCLKHTDNRTQSLLQWRKFYSSLDINTPAATEWPAPGSNLVQLDAIRCKMPG
eukprot:5539138-Pleurochrysis_carterae.AAC.4